MPLGIYIYSNKVLQLIDMVGILNISGSNRFEPVQVSIFITMNYTKPKQAVQSSSVQSSVVHQFAVQFASSEPNLSNTRAIAPVLRLTGESCLSTAGP